MSRAGRRADGTANWQQVGGTGQRANTVDHRPSGPVCQNSVRLLSPAKTAVGTTWKPLRVPMNSAH